ncbi:MAG TPA: alpha/beta hydrolase, partial [Thermoanaerobaculia bacterium]|nr:alpha/beta hydrolase [Thermoanaerobaculia bacterium]
DEMRWYFKQVLVGAEEETAERVLADLEATPAPALVGALESSFGYSPLPALEAYAGPVLSVVSDMNTLPYSLHNLVEELPVRLVSGTSHWLMLDKPDEFNDLLDLFLARVELAGKFPGPEDLSTNPEHMKGFGK